MPRIRRTAILTLLAALLLGAPSFAQTILAGATPGGAFYTIAVPDQWNGGLVIWNRGFDLSPPAPGPDLGPLAPLQLAEGYAIAASSYRMRGWSMFKTNQDLEELVDVFHQEFGVPSHVILFGASLGGLVTVRAIEQADLGNVVGAVPICGVLAGSRNWDAGIDVRLIYDAICSDVPGGFVPGGASGLPFGSTLTINDVVLAINACFGHDLPPAARTAAQQARLNRFLKTTQIPQEFINTSLGFYSMFAMADLVYDPMKLGGTPATRNRNVDYGNRRINNNIQRVGAPKAQRRKLARNYTPTGKVGDVKIVSIHTDRDGLALVENESEYASVVPPGNFTVGIVQEATPTHCGFSDSETVAAWETLRGWLAGDPQPTALTLQVMCLALQPTFGGSCRINPFFQIPDMDGRVRPRNPGNAVRTKSTSSSKASSSPDSAPEPRVGSVSARSPRASVDSPVAEPRVRKLDRRER